MESKESGPSPSTTERTVCVTGVSGFLAAFVTEALLKRGYSVHGTTRPLRDVTDHAGAQQKVAHLRRLAGAADRLKIFEADVMNPEALAAAFRDCVGVFHMATPVEVPLQGEEPVSFEEAQKTQVEPAIHGVKNVFDVCRELGIKRVCLTSSNAAVQHPVPESGVVSEACWSSEAYCKEHKMWYDLAKLQQERVGWQNALSSGITLQAVCPPRVWGPRLSPHLNFSHAVMLEIVNGAYPTIPNDLHIPMVDVRDAAEIHVLAFEAGEVGRFYAHAARLHMRTVADIARRRFPQLAEKIPAALTDENAPITGQVCCLCEMPTQPIVPIRRTRTRLTRDSVLPTWLPTRTVEEARQLQVHQAVGPAVSGRRGDGRRYDQLAHREWRRREARERAQEGVRV